MVDDYVPKYTLTGKDKTEAVETPIDDAWTNIERSSIVDGEGDRTPNPTDIPSSFSVYQTQFMGATVTAFNTKMGWGAESSEVSVDLVEDVSPGQRRIYSKDGVDEYPENVIDEFVPQKIGSPSYFKYGSFGFGGILNNWESSSSLSGATYTLRLQSPSVVLQSAEVILQGLDWEEKERIIGEDEEGNAITEKYDEAKVIFGDGYFPTRLNEDATNLIYFYREYFLKRKKAAEAANPDDPDVVYPTYAYTSDIGVTWSKLRHVIDGRQLFHKGALYTISLSDEFAAMPGSVIFDGDKIDVLSIINKIASTDGRKIYLELEYSKVGNYVTNYIKVKSHSFKDVKSQAVQMNSSDTASAARRLAYGSVHDIIAPTTGTSALGLTASHFKDGDNYTVIPNEATGSKLVNLSRGLEASDVVTHAFINGDWFHDIWQIGTPIGGAPASTDVENCTIIDGIYQYWGQNGAPIDVGGEKIHLTGKNANDDSTGTSTTHTENENVDCYIKDLADLSTALDAEWYNISLFEIRCANSSFASWFEYIAHFKPAVVRKITGRGDKSFGRLRADMLFNLLNTATKKKGYNDKPLADKGVNASRAFNDLAAYAIMKNRADTSRVLMEELHGFVTKVGREYGSQYYIPLPMITKSDNGFGERYNWEIADGGYPRSPGLIRKLGEDIVNEDNFEFLNIGFKNTALELFKTDDGRIKSFVRFQTGDIPATDAHLGPLRTDYGSIGGNWFRRSGDDDVESLYMEASVDTIIKTYPNYDVSDGLVNPGSPEYGAIISIGGCPVNPIQNPLQPVKNLDNALMLLLLDNYGKSLSTPVGLSDEHLKALAKAVRSHAQELQGMAMQPAMRVPFQATIPLKSNVYCYGKWEKVLLKPGEFEVDLDAWAKSEYERISNLNPWNYGSYENMFDAGNAEVDAKICGQHVIESGSVQFAGTPSDLSVNTLGGALGGNDAATGNPLGPVCTNISFDFGVGGAQTTLSFRTFVRNFGDLSRNKIEWMERIAQNNQRLQRAFNLKSAERGQSSQRKMAMNLKRNQKEELKRSGGMGMGSGSPYGGGFGGGGTYGGSTAMMVAEGTPMTPDETDATNKIGTQNKGHDDEEEPSDDNNRKFKDKDGEIVHEIPTATSGRGTVIQQNVSLQTVDRATEGMSADDKEKYRRTAAVSLDALFRPYRIGGGAFAPKDADGKSKDVDESLDAMAVYGPINTKTSWHSADNIDDEAGPYMAMDASEEFKERHGITDYKKEFYWRTGPCFWKRLPPSGPVESWTKAGINAATLNPFMSAADAQLMNLGYSSIGPDGEKVSTGQKFGEPSSEDGGNLVPIDSETGDKDPDGDVKGPDPEKDPVGLSPSITQRRNIGSTITLLEDETAQDATAIKSLALKGPVVISGWGYNTIGNPVPGKDGRFLDDWQNKPHLWPTGPLDILWNESLGKWQANVGWLERLIVNSPQLHMVGFQTTRAYSAGTEIQEDFIVNAKTPSSSLTSYSSAAGIMSRFKEGWRGPKRRQATAWEQDMKCYIVDNGGIASSDDITIGDTGIAFWTGSIRLEDGRIMSQPDFWTLSQILESGYVKTGVDGHIIREAIHGAVPKMVFTLTVSTELTPGSLQQMYTAGEGDLNTVELVEPPFGDELVDQILGARPIFTIWNIKLSTDACADLVAFSQSGVANQRGVLGFNDEGCLTIFNLSECSFGVTPFDNLPSVEYDPLVDTSSDEQEEGGGY